MVKRKRHAAGQDDMDTPVNIPMPTTAGAQGAQPSGADNDSDSENEYWHPVQVQARERQKWDAAVEQLRKSQAGSGRVEVQSTEPECTEWTRHLAVEGDKYFWYSTKTGSTWEDPTIRREVPPGEEETIMVVVPDRAVAGMLLCVDVPPGNSGFDHGWTPMRLPSGAQPGMVYKLRIKRPDDQRRALAAPTESTAASESHGQNVPISAAAASAEPSAKSASQTKKEDPPSTS